MNLKELFATGEYDTDKDTTHSYLEVYDELFAKYKNKPVNLLEIGNNGGESLKLWNAYFDDVKMYGIEINSPPQLMEVDKQLDNLTLYTGVDAYNMRTAKLFDTNFFDIIIDDGSHLPQHQAFAASVYTQLLKAGGTFVIEDIQDIKYAQPILNQLPLLLKDKARIVDRRPVKDRFDDIMIVLEN